MPRSDPEQLRQYQRELMRRRRAEAKGQPKEQSVPTTLSPSPKVQPVTSSGTIAKPKSEAPSMPPQEYIFMNTNIGRIKLPDSVVLFTLKQLQEVGFCMWYHQKAQDVVVQPMVIYKDEKANRHPKAPKGIPDFILDESWGKDDVKNLLLSLTSPTGRGTK